MVRQRLLDLHTGRLPLPDPSHLNSSILLSNIMGYVGAYFSGDSIAAAEILTGIGRPFVQVRLSFIELSHLAVLNVISFNFLLHFQQHNKQCLITSELIRLTVCLGECFFHFF